MYPTTLHWYIASMHNSSSTPRAYTMNNTRKRVSSPACAKLSIHPPVQS